MNTLRQRVSRIASGARALLRPRQSERDLDEEMRAFLETSADAHRTAGLSDADARRAARLDAGSVEGAKDAVRDVGWESLVWSVLRDMRYALRLMRRAPGFTAAVIITLGFGIGGTTAVFSVVDALFLRAPEGVTDPATLRRVFVQRNAGSMQAPDGTAGIWSDARELLERGNAFVATAAYQLPTLVDLEQGAAARQIFGGVVSDDFFGVLGLRPATGRFFLPGDDRTPGEVPVVVVSYELWHSQFGGRPSVVGQFLPVNGQRLRIIGVAPRGFHGVEANPVDVWLPSAMAGALGLASNTGDWRVGGNQISGTTRHVARVAVGVADETSAAQGTAALQHTAEAYPELDPTPEVVLKPLVLAGLPLGTWATDLSPWTAAAALCLLLIACANVANLLLGRSVTRRREQAMRIALGASAWRVVRQHLVECAVLGLLGGVAGLVVFEWLMGFMQAFPIPPAASHLDLRVLAFSIAISIGCGLVFGLAPALRARRLDPISAFKGVPSLSGGGGRPMSRVLVGVQVTLSVGMLVGAALFIRSLGVVAATRQGGDWNRLLIVSAPIGAPRFAIETQEEILTQAQIRLATLPGVDGVTVAENPPLGWLRFGFWRSPANETRPARINIVGPSYFRTLGTRILTGRDIDSSDVAGAATVAVVNEAFARELGGAAAVGQCVPVDRQVRRGGCTRVVGIVESQINGFIDDRNTPTIFQAREQVPLGDRRVPVLIAHVAGTPQVIRRDAQLALQTLRPDLPFITVESMADQLRPAFVQIRLGATLFGLFGGLAALLAGVGLYGLLGYFVTSRTAEFGVRRALGASRAALFRLVFRQSLAPVAIGLAAGLVVAFLGSRYVASMLYGVEARDPISFTAAALFLSAIAIVATTIPALRAVRSDPMSALRQE